MSENHSQPVTRLALKNSIMDKGLYITTKDIMKLIGTDHYNTANRLLLSVRDAIKKKSKSKYLTIRDYCKHEELDFDEIWEFLRGKPYSK